MIQIGDCHELIKNIENESIDFIYFNPPFGTTENEWDTPLNFKELFPEMFRVLKKTGTIAIHCSIPFTYDLIQVKKPNYHYTWNKGAIGNPFIAKRQPLRKSEEILIYYKDYLGRTYNPQKYDLETKRKTMTGKSKYYGGRVEQGKVFEYEGKYPDTILNYKRKIDGFSTRPNELVDFFIKTYTNEGDTVLDLTCYKGLTGKRCELLKRNYIGFDIKDWS